MNNIITYGETVLDGFDVRKAHTYGKILLSIQIHAWSFAR